MRDCSFAELSSICRNHGELGYHLRSMSALVEKKPEEKSYRFTDEGRLIQGLMIQASLELRKRSLDIEVTAKHNPIRYVERLNLGDHAIFLYEDSTFKRAVALPFLRMGLLRGMATVYVASEQRMSQEEKEMERSYPDIEELKERGDLLIMSAEEWYLRRGKASPDVISDNWLRLAREKIKKGYKGLQAAADMNTFLDSRKITELLAYEKKLGPKFPRIICAVCMYEAPRLEPEQIISLIKAHGHGAFEGIGFKLL